jgi:carbonic anhydrase
VTVTDDYLANNAEYAKSFQGPLPLPPSKHVAVVACMDARLDVHSLLGIKEGEAHVIRNAGGVVTDDAIRSLAISQRLLGTQEVILIHHTDCGMLTFTDDDFKRAIQDETGVKPPWSAEAFPDLAEDVRQSLHRIKNSPFVTKHTSARGFIFDVATGKLDEVTSNASSRKSSPHLRVLGVFHPSPLTAATLAGFILGNTHNPGQ